MGSLAWVCVKGTTWPNLMGRTQQRSEKKHQSHFRCFRLDRNCYGRVKQILCYMLIYYYFQKSSVCASLPKCYFNVVRRKKKEYLYHLVQTVENKNLILYQACTRKFEFSQILC